MATNTKGLFISASNITIKQYSNKVSFSVS